MGTLLILRQSLAVAIVVCGITALVISVRLQQYVGFCLPP